MRDLHTSSEPFDEFAALHLLKCHYYLAAASKNCPFPFDFKTPTSVIPSPSRKLSVLDKAMNMMEGRVRALESPMTSFIIRPICPSDSPAVKVLIYEAFADLSEQSRAVRKHLADVQEEDLATDYVYEHRPLFWVAASHGVIFGCIGLKFLVPKDRCVQVMIINNDYHDAKFLLLI